MLWLCWVNSSFGRYIENKSLGHRGFRAVMQFLAKCPLSLDTGGCHIVTVSQKADPTSRILVYSETCRLPLSGFTHIACGLKATVPPAELSKVSFCLRLCTHMLKAGVRWILPNRILKFPPPLRTRVIWCSCPNVGIYWIGSTNPPLCHTERLPVVCARKLGAQHMESVVPAAQWVEPQRPMESPKDFLPSLSFTQNLWASSHCLECRVVAGGILASCISAFDALSSPNSLNLPCTGAVWVSLFLLSNNQQFPRHQVHVCVALSHFFGAIV